MVITVSLFLLVLYFQISRCGLLAYYPQKYYALFKVLMQLDFGIMRSVFRKQDNGTLEQSVLQQIVRGQK
jgi:hypothetical protein